MSKYTAVYILWQFPALVMYGYCNLTRNVLNSFKLNSYPFWCYAIAISLHPVWSYIFVVKHDLEIYGLAAACFLTFTLAFILQKLLIWRLDLFQGQQVRFLDKNTFDKVEIKRYIKTALPLVFSSILENWLYEIMTLAAGIIGLNA